MKKLILLKQADLVIPQSHLEKVMALGPVCAGLATNTVDDKGPHIVLEHWPDLKDGADGPEAVVKNLMEIQEQLKTNRILFWFGDNAGEVTVAADNVLDTPDMQPFPFVSSEDGRIHLVGVLHGNFVEFAKEDGKHTPEHYAVIEDVQPRLTALFESKDGHIGKVMDEIRGSAMLKRDLKKLSLDDSSIITLMAADGDVLTLAKRTDVKGLLYDTDWGWTTDPIEGVLDDKKEEPKPVSKLGKFLGKVTGTASPAPAPEKVEPKVDTPKPVETKPEEKKEPVVEPPKTDTAVKAPEKEMVQCPTGMTKQQMRSWYLEHAGHVPTNFKKRPKVEVQKADTKDLKQLDKVLEQAVKPQAVKEVKPGVYEVPPKAKDTEPKHVAVTGIMPAAMLSALTKDPVVAKLLDQNSTKVSPEQFIKDERKAPSFSEQTGLDLSDIFGWSPDDILQFVRHYDQGAVALIDALRGAYARSKLAEKKIVPQQEQETGAPAVKQETKAAPAAEKKSMFGSFSKLRDREQKAAVA